MAAGIINAICTYVSANAYGGIGCTVFDGEVTRYDINKQSVSPDSSGGQSDWPVIKFSMPPKNFHRNHTFEEAYYDDGVIVCQIWHTTRDGAEKTLDMIEVLLAPEDTWVAIGKLIPSPYVNNPHYVIQLLLSDWGSYQVEGFRTQKSELVYTCEAYYKTNLHGALPLTSGAAAAASSFTPSQLSNLAGWWKADAAVFSDAGVTPATDGQSVKQWNDQSTAGANAVQDGANAVPVFKANVRNGLPVIRFTSGSSQYLKALFTAFGHTSATVFVAANYTAPAAEARLFEFRRSTNANPILAAIVDAGGGGSDKARLRNDAGTLADTPTFAAAAGAWHVFEYYWDGSNLTFMEDSNVVGSVAATGTVTLDGLGMACANIPNNTAGNFLTVDIGEMIYCQAPLNGSLRASTRSYLKSRWSTP